MTCVYGASKGIIIITIIINEVDDSHDITSGTASWFSSDALVSE